MAWARRLGRFDLNVIVGNVRDVEEQVASAALVAAGILWVDAHRVKRDIGSQRPEVRSDRG